jgi:hypothetical protein
MGDCDAQMEYQSFESVSGQTERSNFLEIRDLQFWFIFGIFLTVTELKVRAQIWKLDLAGLWAHHT